MRTEVYAAHLDLHKILDMQGQLHKIFILKPDLAARYFRAQRFHKATETYYNELYLILTKLVDEQKVGRRPFISVEEILHTPLEDRLLSDVIALNADVRGDSLARLYVQPPFQPSIEDLNKVLEAETRIATPEIVIKKEDETEELVQETAQRQRQEFSHGDDQQSQTPESQSEGSPSMLSSSYPSSQGLLSDIDGHGGHGHNT